MSYLVLLKNRMGKNGNKLLIKNAFNFVRAFIPLNVRYRPEFNQILHLLKYSESWDLSKVEDFQYRKTLKLLEFAEKNVEWYKRSFSNWGVSSRSFKSLEDIKSFPTISKEEVQQNLSLFLAKGVKKNKLYYLTTAGSTGIPFGFYQSSSLIKIEKAFFAYHWGLYGCHLDDLSVVLRGGFVGDENHLFSYNQAENAWHFSSYYLTENNLGLYFNN